MTRIRVGVLCGGFSAERDVSLVTGRAVFNNLDRKVYKPTLVELTQQKTFLLIKANKKIRFDFFNKAKKLFDVIFIALHGTGGEDGSLQGMLQTLNIPYTGSDVLASALAMNKVYTASVYGSFGIPTPDFVHCNQTSWKRDKELLLTRIRKDIGFPAVVKPVDQGSAVGVSIVGTEKELIATLNKTFKDFPWLMVQKFIKGTETTCGVLEKNGRPFALPPTRIIPQMGAFYDYTSKYAEGGSRHVCPADFGPQVNMQLQTMALQAHQALGCTGMSRTDMFVTEEGKFYALETNTIPGMTPTSLLPEAAQVAGYSFPEMLDLIIKARI